MSTNGRVHLDLNGDLRLLAGLSGAVEHFAQQVGLGEPAQRDLITAAEEACRDTFRLLTPESPTLRVTIVAHLDRVEVSLEHRGEAVPTAGLDTFFGAGAKSSTGGELTGLSLMKRVDRVQYHTEGGTSRTTLVKYLKPPKK